MTDDRFLLKDFFNAETIGVVADAIAKAEPGFDRDAFLDQVFDADWKERELKQRMRHVAQCLRDTLAGEYRTALTTLLKAAGDVKEAGFAAMVLSDFVEAFGIDDIDASIPALERFTQNVSAEFAVRPFLIAYPDLMLEQMKVWATHDDAAVRRLASEGTRPRLPWGKALKQYQTDPTPIVPLLASLSHDPSEDVRRSVANSLNDIAKDHPDLVVDVLEQWQDGSEEVKEITKHALRVLLKKGHSGALGLLGFSLDPKVVIDDLTADPEQVQVGGKVTISFTIASTSDKPQPLIIDGVVHYVRKNGTSTKVFKWKTTDIAPGERLTIKRTVSLQPMSTRRILPGRHVCEVQINGTRMANVEFDVTE